VQCQLHLHTPYPWHEHQPRAEVNTLPPPPCYSQQRSGGGWSDDRPGLDSSQSGDSGISTSTKTQKWIIHTYLQHIMFESVCLILYFHFINIIQ
jgi:hypothetical protein